MIRSSSPGGTGAEVPASTASTTRTAGRFGGLAPNVEWAAGEKRSWLEQQGISFVATVGWAERGGMRADGHGNSVPRFHIAWGTGTGVVKPFDDAAHAAVESG